MKEITKICKGPCGLEKSLDCFYIRNDSGKYRNNCIECFLIKSNERYLNNRESILIKQKEYNNKEENKKRKSEYDKKYYIENVGSTIEYQKEYRKNNGEKIANYKKEYYLKNKDGVIAKYIENNKESISKYGKEYNGREENKDRRNTVRREKYSLNFTYKMRQLCSSKVTKGLKTQGLSKNGESSLDYFGDNYFAKLFDYLESLFEPWMNWENWKVYNYKTWNDNDRSTWTWNIDHIIPQSALLYNSMNDSNFKVCWSISNLRPLSSKENILKSNKISDELYNITMVKIEKELGIRK